MGLDAEQKSISRRNFLRAAGTTLGMAAASSFAKTKQSPDAERLSANAQAPFFRSGENTYEHPSGMQVTIGSSRFRVGKLS